MNRDLLDRNRISQLRDIIRIAQQEIADIESRNFGSTAYRSHIEGSWFVKGQKPCTMPQGHPSHCGCEW